MELLPRYLLLALILQAVPGWAQINKDPNDEETRVKVRNVVLQDFRSYPEHGITATVVLDLIRVNQVAYGKWMTLTELHGLADAVSQLYKDAGFQFSYAYVPQQKLDAGSVNIAIVEGRLGDIKVYNASLYSDAQIRQPFEAFLGKVFRKGEIEKAMEELKAFPGLAVFGYYSRGSKPGETRLNIRVTAEQSWLGNARLDNYGSESTGEKRLVGQFSLINPAGLRDQLTIGIQQSVEDRDGENNTYGLLRYTLPLLNMNHLLSASLSNNQFEVGDSFSDLDLQGDARIARLNYTWVVRRASPWAQSISLFLEDKTSDFDNSLTSNLLDQGEDVRSTGISWQLNHNSVDNRWLNSLSASFYDGEYDSELTGASGEAIEKFELAFQSSLSLGDFSQLSYSILSLMLRGQHTEKYLPNIEQILLSGPYSVRAIKSGYFSADRGGIASFEWSLPSLLPRAGENNALALIPSVFIDSAYGDKLDSNDQIIDRAKLSGYGLALDLIWGKKFNARLSLSDIDSDDVNSGTMADQRQLLFETTYLLH